VTGGWKFLRQGEKWIVTSDDDYLDKLLAAKGNDDRLLDKQVQSVLVGIRIRAAVESWIALVAAPFKLVWELTYGRYRRATKKVDSGANAPSGASPGTVSLASQQGASFSSSIGTGGSGGSSTAFGAGGSTVGCAILRSIVFADAGIKAGEVTAYRCWKLGSDGLLRSIIMDHTIWYPGEVIEGNPTENSAGVHAFKTLVLACRYAGTPSELCKIVTGTVEMWGTVYEHARGYRASHAAIASIDDSPDYDAKALRKLYGLTKKRKKK
jgi:hypothetical protein